MRRAIALLVFVMVAAIARAAGAQSPPATPPSTLPEFTLTALDGTAAGSASIRQADKWLFVYVEAGSQACEDMLALLRPDGEAPTEAEAATIRRTVVVVGGDLDAARQVREAFPYLAPAAWYADVNHAAFDGLALQGVPVALGLRAEAIEWRMNGVLPDKRNARAVLRGW